MRRLMLVLSFAVVATALVAGSAKADDDEDADDAPANAWSVTITNLTPPGAGPPGSQPLSPPLFVVHTRRTDVWSVGEIANHGVAAIAEDANNAVLESALSHVSGVKSVFTGEGGPIPSGQSRTYTVQTGGRFNRLSLLTMLVNTNDAFTGLDSLRASGSTTQTTMAYDAGSERNNELKAYIPGPCCGNPFVRDPEGALIRPHEGIRGDAQLDASVYGWRDPVARITIRPVS